MTDMSQRRQGALTDLKVIECAQLIAGPFCGQLLADHGAQVIKVEQPGVGDPMRTWGRDGFPLSWEILARNKESVFLNLRDADGQTALKALVAEADILIENFRPGTMEKWGLSYETLSAINPALIMVRVSGYGQTGPYAKRAGYAAVGEAMGGLRALMGDPDRKPARAGISLGDSLAGMFATIGALTALHHRDRTGEGQVVDASIYESVLALTEATIPEHAIEGFTRQRSGSYLPGIAPSNIYDCADGQVVIGANQDTVFARLAEAMGAPELASDPRYGDHVARGENQIELDARITDWTSQRSADAVQAIMDDHGVPCSKLYRAADMLTDPHYAAREAVVTVQSDRYGQVPMPGVFPKLSKTPGAVRHSGKGTPDL
ncbi:CaiB/BaiF CoA transferase family protein [Algimonas porphyrae]|uniref:Succinyl-CoA--D-citramalate CoA-transferase n=1 Tax=Algimonas porphyrae TaxID=1128113 RepID=A0ABQ5UXI8_9PROT|nr:CoA transferase [Algimonas porphyrae]GLQ19873.1 succinyl-CoA--D-citramalate CoA-transferase [Algimonas porphyrae]